MQKNESVTTKQFVRDTSRTWDIPRRVIWDMLQSGFGIQHGEDRVMSALEHWEALRMIDEYMCGVDDDDPDDDPEDRHSVLFDIHYPADYTIPGTAGMKVTVDGEEYTLACDIEYTIRDGRSMVTPVAQTFHPSHPGEIGEIAWNPLWPDELSAWLDAGKFDSDIDGILWTDGDD